MSFPTPPAHKSAKHFTPFYSAAEEANLKVEEESWDNEGGHMSASCGRVVRTPGAELPYKVMLTRDGRAETTHSFATMREAESFIRRSTPVSPARSTLRDHDEGQAFPVHTPKKGISQ